MPKQEPEPTDRTPPKPKLVLRIGVTGHRPDLSKRSDPDLQMIRKFGREILQHISDVFKGIAKTHSHVFDCGVSADCADPVGSLRMISALAAGADQWIALEAIELGYELQSPIPFSYDEYLLDFTGDLQSGTIFKSLFSQATATLELDGAVTYDSLGKRKVDSASYESVGRVMLNQSDILIAVWDGKGSRGRGGSGQVVEEALQRGIPVIWIPWTNAEEWKLLEPRWRVLERPEDVRGELNRLGNLVRELLLPPEPNHLGQNNIKCDLRDEYFLETQKSGNPLIGLWDLFRDCLSGRIVCWKIIRKWVSLKPFAVADFMTETSTKWRKIWPAQTPAEPVPAENDTPAINPPKKTLWVRVKQWFCPPDPAGKSHDRRQYYFTQEICAWVQASFLRHYAFANGLSVYYAKQYRGSFVLNFFLGSMAVFSALMAAVLHGCSSLSIVWVCIELGLITVILWLTWLGHRGRWHERWIDYRTLAERLRIAHFLAPFGGGGQQVSQAEHLASYGNPASTWMHWLYRAIERAAGLPNAKFNNAYLLAYQDLWQKSLIADQIGYHIGVSEQFSKLDRRLHISANGLFAATLVICLSHFCVHHIWPHDEIISLSLSLIAAFFPAVGAALSAIRSQAEFHRVSQRSFAMSDRLGKLRIDLAAIPSRPNELNSVELRECVGKVTDLMINEMLDWRVVFQDRPLSLPS
jgi:hypothetical protein